MKEEIKVKKHIAMCSFGKDSMAMLYTMKKYDLPIDMIV